MGTSKPRLTSDFVTISRDEYEELKAYQIYADLVGDFIDDMPVFEEDLFKDDPRYKAYLRVVNPEYCKELYGNED
jgi:hypothetical protein